MIYKVIVEGRPLQYTIIDDKKIPVHPHPLYILKEALKK